MNSVRHLRLSMEEDANLQEPVSISLTEPLSVCTWTAHLLPIVEAKDFSESAVDLDGRNVLASTTRTPATG